MARPTISRAVEDAMSAAASSYALGVRIRAAATTPFMEWVTFLNSLQDVYERVQALGAFSQSAVTAKAEDLYPGAMPDDLWASIAAVQAAGAALNETVKDAACDPAGIAALGWDMAGGRLLPRNLTRSQLATNDDAMDAYLTPLGVLVGA